VGEALGPVMTPGTHPSEDRPILRAGLLVFALSASSSGAAAEEVAPIVAVFGIEDTRSQKSRLLGPEIQALTDYLAARLSASGAYKIVPGPQLREALSEKKKESYKACYDTACQIEIGKEVAANKTLSTKILFIGKKCIVISTLYDLRAAASERSADHEGGCDGASLGEAIKQVAAALGAGGPAAPRGSLPAALSGGYDALDRDAKAARTAEAKAEAERAARLAALERAWTVVRTVARDRRSWGEEATGRPGALSPRLPQREPIPIGGRGADRAPQKRGAGQDGARARWAVLHGL
jgi:hypothetical protein